VELFFDPHRPLVKLRAGYALAKKLLGFRYLMDVVSLDATIVRGSHGRLPERPEDGPVVISSEKIAEAGPLPMTAVHRLVLDLLRG